MKRGGLEAGGTKMVCAVEDETGRKIDQTTIPTTTPEETMPPIISFFSQHQIDALGIGSFGPLDLMAGSETYGALANTPKQAWVGYPLLQALREALRIPIKITTDVNAAALAETTTGAAKGLDSCIYITVGTGIGGGAIVNEQILEGLSHPEMGHVSVPRHPDDTFPGVCHYHQDCLEGLACGPAIEQRWGKSGAELAKNPKVWEMEAYYLAEGIKQYIYILMPKKIIIGGGVMHQEQLFGLIQSRLQTGPHDYVPFLPEQDYIVPPILGDQAGITGAMLLSRQTDNE